MANKEYMQTPMEVFRAERIMKRIANWINPSLLEVGCGVGHMTGKLLKLTGGDLHAIDIDPVCVTSCALAHPDAKVSEGDIRAPNFPARTFQTIVAVNVLEHLDDPVGAVYQMHRMLQSGGSLIVSVPNACSPHRYAGVDKGIIDKVTDLGPADIKVGHKQVFTLPAIESILGECLKLRDVKGSYYKVYPNSILEQLLKDHPESTGRLLSTQVAAQETADLILLAERG